MRRPARTVFTAARARSRLGGVARGGLGRRDQVVQLFVEGLETLGLLGLAVEVEKEIINILVASDQVDNVFEKIYLAGELSAEHMGRVDAEIMRSVSSIALTQRSYSSVPSS